MATMTVSEFLADIALESAVVSNEFICEAALFDLSTGDYDDTYASESAYDLAIDDDDETLNYAYESSGFTDKFKDMLDKISEWFKKIAKSIKTWIDGLVEKIRGKKRHNEMKDTAMQIAGAKADLAAANSDAKIQAEQINKRITELSEELDNETDAAKRSKLSAQIKSLNNKLEEVSRNTDNAKVDSIVKIGTTVSNAIGQYFKAVNGAYTVAAKSTETIEGILRKIIDQPIDGNKKGARLEDYANNQPIMSPNSYSEHALKVSNSAAKAALIALDGKNNTFWDKTDKQLEAISEKVDKTTTTIRQEYERVENVQNEFKDAMKGVHPITRERILNQVKAPFPDAAIVASANDIIKSCKKFSETAEALKTPVAKAKDEKSKAIAKALSKYSTVANNISTLAGYVVKCGNMGSQFMNGGTIS